MLQVELIKDRILKYGSERGKVGISNSIHLLAMNLDIPYPSIYRVLKNKKCSMDMLIAFNKELGLSFDEMIIVG